jgi:hypothetical protein
MKLALFLALCLSVVACQASASDAATSATAAGATVSESAAQVPLIVAWHVQSDTGGRLRITAVLTRRSTLHVPIDVHIEVPPGLQLVSGTTDLKLEPNLPPGQTEVALEFQYSTPPQTDLKVVALASGSGMGIHAADSYRFGRPAQPAPHPQPSGLDHHFGNVDLGPAVPIEQK